MNATSTGRGRISIGCSGWSYPHWQGSFFPASIDTEDQLEYYSRYLPSVEINSSFYRLPSRETLRRWYAAVPENFVFSVKASRYLTHMKKLNNPAESIAEFTKRIDVLADKLGPVLFQLPPRWRFNEQRLSAFLESLSREYRYAFEFRDHSWICSRTYDLLAAHAAAFCIYEIEGFLTPKTITTDLVYVRLHGPKAAYQGDYDTSTLAGWAGAFSTWSAQGRQVYCYFDNDQSGYAAKNALALNKMLSGIDRS